MRERGEVSDENRPLRYTLQREAETSRPQRFLIDYQKELNPAQYEAVITYKGPLLVLAGAGSGKTRTLVYRVARMVEEGIDPAAILLLTFTRRAAEEMLQRAGALLGGRCDKVTGGTFHSFANTVLRRYAALLGFANSFTILDRSDSEDVINLIRARLG
ncbi:MAG: UvrD-helicase domain-containing protein, partial [Deltaproteobacteria bacterium]|nr:UvrD-helicase domain-containing protein [Deltaproteobacteria bacterium]